MNSDNTELEVGVIPIDLENDTTCIFNNHYTNVVQNYYSRFLSSNN